MIAHGLSTSSICPLLSHHHINLYNLQGTSTFKRQNKRYLTGIAFNRTQNSIGLQVLSAAPVLRENAGRLFPSAWWPS